MKYSLFLDEVLVHEPSQSVGVAKVTYYPIDGTFKDLRIGLELRDGTRRDFALSELRRAGPEEQSNLTFVPDSEV